LNYFSLLQELNDVTVICEDSVEVYSQRHYKILRKKTYRVMLFN